MGEIVSGRPFPGEFGNQHVHSLSAQAVACRIQKPRRCVSADIPSKASEAGQDILFPDSHHHFSVRPPPEIVRHGGNLGVGNLLQVVKVQLFQDSPGVPGQLVRAAEPPGRISGLGNLRNHLLHSRRVSVLYGFHGDSKPGNIHGNVLSPILKAFSAFVGVVGGHFLVQLRQSLDGRLAGRFRVCRVLHRPADVERLDHLSCLRCRFRFMQIQVNVLVYISVPEKLFRGKGGCGYVRSGQILFFHQIIIFRFQPLRGAGSLPGYVQHVHVPKLLIVSRLRVYGKGAFVAFPDVVVRSSQAAVGEALGLHRLALCACLCAWNIAARCLCLSRRFCRLRPSLGFLRRVLRLWLLLYRLCVLCLGLLLCALDWGLSVLCGHALAVRRLCTIRKPIDFRNVLLYSRVGSSSPGGRCFRAGSSPARRFGRKGIGLYRFRGGYAPGFFVYIFRLHKYVKPLVRNYGNHRCRFIAICLPEFDGRFSVVVAVRAFNGICVLHNVRDCDIIRFCYRSLPPRCLFAFVPVAFLNFSDFVFP